MLTTTGEEYPEFIAALSLIFALEPDEARERLEQREQRLTATLWEVEAELRGASALAGLPRVFLLEEEYRRAVLKAELTWIRRLIADLKDGRLTWSEEWLREMFTRYLPDDEREVPAGS